MKDQSIRELTQDEATHMVVGRQTRSASFGLISFTDNEPAANNIRNNIIFNGGSATVIPFSQTNFAQLQLLIEDSFFGDVSNE